MPSLRTVRRSGCMETLRQSPSLCRAADVLYLLGRGAQLEHPHMINVQYASHQPGPTLKDVKNRLIRLRGSGMPGSFSWSYKRNYKDTFIWCDLFDDDFIFPLCETGEYVLKAMELFNASQDKDVIECKELHMPTQSLPIRNLRVSSPVKSLRSSTREEHFDLESDVSMAIKKSLILISDAGDVTFDSSLNLSKQTMNNLSHNKRALEVGNLDHSDVSNTGTYASLDAVENKRFSYQQKSKCNAARTEKATVAELCNAGSQTAHRETSLQRGACSRDISPAVGNPGEDTDYPRNEMRGFVPMAGNSLTANQCSAGSQTSFRETSLQRGVAKDCNQLVDRSAAAIIKKNDMLAFSPSPTTTPNAQRRTWEKEINKGNMYTGLSHSKSSDDEHLSPHREVHESSSPCLSALEDPFLYSVLRKAIRLGSFRPRMCRGVDVVNSTRARTKMHFRSKPREVGNKVPKKSGKQPRCLVDETSKNNNSCSKSPEIHSSYTSSERPVKELKTLSHYFETTERTSSVIKLMSEVPSIEVKPRQQLTSIQAESQAIGTAALATNPPRPEFRSSGNDALDASYRKTMEVLAKLPARGVRKVHTTPQGEKIADAVIRVVSEAEEHRFRSESEGSKQGAKLYTKSSTACTLPPGQVPVPRVEPDAHNSCSMHNTHGRTAAITLEESSKNMSSRQRRPKSKKSLGKINGSSLHLISSQRSDVTLKIPDERTIKVFRNSSKESSPKLCAEQSNTEKASIISQLSESFLFDSRTSHSGSGNELGLKRSIQIATKADTTAVANPEQTSHEVSKGWPFDQPVRPKDYKSREDRLLTPGLTQTDWEKSLQEAVMKSEPPMNLVLHECSQCGRTFKLESLQVHMRGCHAINKSKLSSQRRKVSV